MPAFSAIEYDENVSCMEEGSLQLRLKKTDGDNNSRVYVGARRVLSASVQNNKVYDIDGFFAMDYYCGQDAGANVSRIPYYFFEFYLKRSSHLYQFRPRFLYIPRASSNPSTIDGNFIEYINAGKDVACQYSIMAGSRQFSQFTKCRWMLYLLTR